MTRGAAILLSVDAGPAALAALAADAATQRTAEMLTGMKLPKGSSGTATGAALTQ